MEHSFAQSVICSKDVAGILKEDARKRVFPSCNASRKAGSEGTSNKLGIVGGLPNFLSKFSQIKKISDLTGIHPRYDPFM